MEQNVIILQNEAKTDKKNAYHPAFVCSLEMVLYAFRSSLQYEPEHPVSQEPQYIDVLVLDKDLREREKSEGCAAEDDMDKQSLPGDQILRSDQIKPGDQIPPVFAECFRRHTVIEYKGLGDSLNMRVIQKAAGYASMYYAMQTKIAPVEIDDLSVCIFRNAFPRKLFSELKKLGIAVVNKHDGIYRLEGIAVYPVWVVIIRKLPEKAGYAPMRILTGKPEPEDIRDFLRMTGEHKKDPDYNRLAHTVADTAYRLNRELFERISKEEANMTGTIIDLVEDQVQEREKAAAEKAKAEMRTEIESRDNKLREKEEQLEETNELLEKKTKEIQVLKSQLASVMEILKKANIAAF